MSIITNNTNLTINSSYNSPQDVRDKFIEIALKTLKEITTDTQMRLKGCENNIQLLGSGIFYANEYYLALKKTHQTARLNFLKNKGSFFHGHVPTKFFTLKPEIDPEKCLTGTQPQSYQLRPEKHPTEGLKALREGLTFLACGEVCMLAYCEALLALIGEEKFNAIFGHNSSTPFFIKTQDPNNSLFPLMISPPPSETPIRPGQIVHFSNVPNYHVKHYNGESIGQFTLSLDHGSKFIGFGLDPEGVDREQISQFLLDEYNRAPINEEIVTEEVTKRIFTINTKNDGRFPLAYMLTKSNTASRELFDLAGGGKLTQIFDFNEEKVFVLMQSSTQKCVKLMNKWEQERKAKVTLGAHGGILF